MNGAPEDSLLPELRPELEIMRGAPTATGEPTWLIHDPVQNRFVQIDLPAYEALKAWPRCRTIDDLMRYTAAEKRVSLSPEAIEELTKFLEAQNLVVPAKRGAWRQLATATAGGKKSIFSQIAHNYFFYRIPLFRPQRLLENTQPVARALASWPALFIIGLMGLIGVYLVSKELDVFTTSLQDSFTWEGLVTMAFALAVVKGAHELGHAYTAVAYGCRVHSMGLAFIFLAPLPYTDVTDSWRLRDRRKRLAIDSAGIAVELAIAAIALFFWAFLPDGTARNIAFTLSVVSLISSFIINLNPFMRFDGYYLLADILGIDNLQARAFEMGRWKLREILFGLNRPPPEEFPAPFAIFIVLYAWATWIYRLVLFVGIALLVYSYFFKVLGILLLITELFYFVGRPIMNELKIWNRDRAAILATRRTRTTAALAATALLLAIVPWSTRVEIPAVVETAKSQSLYPVQAARIIENRMKHGQHVAKGDVLLQLQAPAIESEIRQTRLRLGLARLQHGRRAADNRDLSSSMVIESAIKSLQTKLAGLEQERAKLTVRAPFNGHIVEVGEDLHAGRWIATETKLAVVAANGGAIARGYVSEDNVSRLKAGSSGRFVPEEASRRSLSVRLDRIAPTGSATIDIPELASIHTGRITVLADQNERLVPATAQYSVSMTVLSDNSWNDLSVRGVVIAEGRAESVLARVWRRTLKVLVRESGA